MPVGRNLHTVHSGNIDSLGKIFFYKQQSGICTKIKDITFKKDVPKG
jgi:hypothetical protein